MRNFGNYVIWKDEEGTKPANTVKSYLVMALSKEDEYIAFIVVLIEIRGKDQSHEFKESPIAITRHAYERVIQSSGSTNVKQVAEILHVPVLSMIARINQKGVLNKDEEFRFSDQFGMFIFRGDDEGECLLKTVIKADALEGEKLREWESAIRKPHACC